MFRTASQRYHYRKKNGLCTTDGCKNKSEPEKTLCTHHAEALSKKIKGYLDRKPHIPKSKWESVDWTRTDVHIAEDLGVGLSAVESQRYKRRGPYVPPYRVTRWNDIDWTKTDTYIARILGVSKGAVWKQRKKHEHKETTVRNPQGPQAAIKAGSLPRTAGDGAGEARGPLPAPPRPS